MNAILAVIEVKFEKRSMYMKKMVGFLSVVVLTFALVGCGGSESDEQVLRIGLAVDESNPDSGIANEAFRVALEEYLGIPVIEVEGVTYVVGIEAMRAGNLDMMFASSFNYVQASQALDVEILATLESSGADTVTYFITHVDNTDINSIEDLEGRTFAFVDAASTSGYLFPKYHLVTNLSLDPTLLMNSGYFFSTATFSGGHDTSTMGVNFKDFEGAAVVDLILERLTEAGVIDAVNIKIIGQTEPHPAPSYIARADMDADLMERIRGFLLSYDDPAFFEAVWSDPNTRFVAPDIEGYARIMRLVETLGINQ